MADEVKDPLQDDHVNFARAVVALAREHAVNHIDMTFDLSGTRLRFFREGNSWQKVNLQWHEERHGSAGRLVLSAEARVTFSEDTKTGLNSAGN